MQKIVKKDIVEELAEKLHITKKAAGEYVDGVFDAIVAQLEKGNSVSIKDLGTFKVKEKSAREGINPTTKEKITIPAKKVVSFKQASNLEIK